MPTSEVPALCVSCQGESGAAGENGSPGPMVSIFLSREAMGMIAMCVILV